MQYTIRYFTYLNILHILRYDILQIYITDYYHQFYATVHHSLNFCSSIFAWFAKISISTLPDLLHRASEQISFPSTFNQSTFYQSTFNFSAAIGYKIIQKL